MTAWRKIGSGSIFKGQRFPACRHKLNIFLDAFNINPTVSEHRQKKKLRLFIGQERFGTEGSGSIKAPRAKTVSA
jgi:hypothetical protein